MRASRLLLIGAALGAIIGSWTPNADAYPLYRVAPGQDCVTCHGDFRASGYVDRTDGQTWDSSLHNTHRFDMLSGDCLACHLAPNPNYTTPFLKQSAGGVGFEPISCVGCHGRAEDDADPLAGYGAGLRQHHWNAGITNCVGCHPDSNPANYTPAREQIDPPYYFLPDPSHPTKPTDPCNPPPDYPEGIYAASIEGLDNDGDDLFDQDDPNCGGNTPPVAQDDAYSTDEDTPLVVPAPGVLDNDTDDDMDTLTAILVSDPSNGSVALGADGSFTYNPDPDYNGPDSFTYMADDGIDSSNVATVSLTVNDVNDPPVADPNGPYSGVVGSPVTFDGSGSFDVDGTVQSYAWDFGDGNTGTGVAPTHTYADPGTFTVTLTVTDDDGDPSGAATTTAEIEAATNEPPVAMDDAYSTDEDMQLVVRTTTTRTADRIR